MDMAILAFIVVSVLAFPVIFQSNGIFFLAEQRTGWYSSPLPLKECLSMVLIPIILALFLARAIVMKQFEYLRSPYNPLMAAIIPGVIFYTLLSPSIPLAGRDALLTIEHILFFFVLMTRTRERRFRRLLYGTLIGCVFLVALAAFLQTRGIYLGFLIGSQLERQFMASTFGHNNGVASFLMMGTLLMIGVGVSCRGERRWIARGVLLLLIIFNLYLLMASGTRGAWGGFLIGAILFYFVLIGFRRRLRQWRIRFLIQSVAAIALALVLLGAFLLLTGIDQFFKNYLKSRIEATQSQWLIENARPRLARIGVDMISDHPLFGLGFAGFKMDYPVYQADYFLEHPQSPLIPTDKHSDQTHNDWLQIWIEFGVLGLLAVVYFLALHFWYAYKVVHRWRNDMKTVQYLGAFAATTALCFNNVLSFEFHVQPNAMMFLTCLALMAGLDGHTRFRTYDFRNLGQTPSLRNILIALLLLTACLAGLKPASWAIGDSFYAWGNRIKIVGTDHLKTGDRQKAAAYLGNAAHLMDKARQLAPYYGFYAFNLAQLKAFLVSAKMPMLEPGGKATPVTYEDVIRDLREAMQTWRYKDIYYIWAKVRSEQLRSQNSVMSPDQRSRMIKEITDNYLMAVNIYPLDFNFRYEYARFLHAMDIHDTAAEQFETLRKQDEGKLMEYLDRDLKLAFKAGDPRAASSFIDLQYRTFPNHWPYAFSKALALWEYGQNKEEALKIVYDYNKRNPLDKRAILGVVTLHEQFGELDKAEEALLKTFQGTDINEEVATMYLYMDDFLRRTGQGYRLNDFWTANLAKQKILGPRARTNILVRLGRLHLAMGDLDLARRELAEAYRLNKVMKKALAYQEAIDSTRLAPLLLTQ